MSDNLFSSSKDVQQAQTTVSNPWAVQTPYLQAGFDAARDALRRSQTANGANAPTDFVAQFSPGMLDAFRQAANYGVGNLGNFNNYGRNNAFAGAGIDAATGALSSLRDWTPQSTADNILRDTTTLSANPQVDGMVRAALTDDVRKLGQDLRTNFQGSARAGTINSNKSAIRDAIAERAFNDRAANVSATIRGDVWNNASNIAANNLRANDSNRLGALSTALSGGTGALATSTGANATDATTAGRLFDITNAGNAGVLAGDQANLDNLLQRWNFNTNVSPWAGINNFWNIVGSNNWGGTQSSTGSKTETSTPSVASQIGAGVGAMSQFFPGANMFGPIGSMGSGLAGLFGGFGTNSTRGQNWWS